MSTGKPERKAQILLVDDHPVVRKALAALVQSQPDMTVCGEAGGLTETLQFVSKQRPDLTVIDLSLEDGSGIELIKEIKARDPHARMVVSSMHDEALFAERVLRAGAMGYVSKGADAEIVLAAFREVLEGRIALSPEVAERILFHSVRSSRQAPSWIETLTDRELETFELLGRGLSTRQIADRLQLSPKTVESYREHIKGKLGLSSSAELMHRATEWVLKGC